MSSYTNFQVDKDNPNSSWTVVYNLIKPKAKLLDIGCSSGYFDKFLKDGLGAVVDGVEIDPNDAELAVKHCRQVVVGNVEDAKFDWEKLDTDYDYILFIDVLEHLLNPTAVLKKVSKMLTPGGKIIFSIPNMANAAVRLQLLQGNFDYESEGLLDETHLHYYTGKTIKQMINKAGLKLTKLESTTFDPPKAMVESTLNKVGLNPTEEFYNFITKKDALVYQYIGEMSASGEDLDLQDVLETIKPRMLYEEQIKEVQNLAVTLQRDNDLLRQQIENREKDINELKSTLTLKLKDIDELMVELDHRQSLIEDVQNDSRRIFNELSDAKASLTEKDMKIIALEGRLKNQG